MSPPRSVTDRRSTWSAPVAIGVVTAAGLASPLLFDGLPGQIAVCLSLAVPIVVIGWRCARQ